MKKFIVSEWNDSKLLFRNIPSIIIVIFVVSVVAMNILAGKTIYSGRFLALDGGFLISWISFLTMDIITKYYGPKASTKLSILAILVNLFTCLVFYIVSIIPTENPADAAFNTVVGGTWFVLMSSTIAFFLSAIINNLLNWWIGKLFKDNKHPKIEFYCRSYVSTFIGQFFDNFIFSVLAFMVFFPMFQGWGWTFIQTFMCSLVGAACELVAEILFSPLGYRIVRKWQKENFGEAYFRSKQNEGAN